MGGLSIEGGDGDGIGSIGDDGLEVLEQETAVQSIGAVLDEVAGRQLVGTQDTDVRKVGGVRLYLKDEGGRES
jgi:hypothetical protein